MSHGVDPRLTIYQKPTCSTCRGVMTRLNEMGFEYDAINYILDPPSRAKLVELLRKMGDPPVRSIMRTKEPLFSELGLNDPSTDDELLLDAMAAHPSLLQRPVIEYGERALLARPIENLERILEWRMEA